MKTFGLKTKRFAIFGAKKAKAGIFGLKNSSKNAPILTTAVNNPHMMSKTGNKSDGIEKI